MYILSQYLYCTKSYIIVIDFRYVQTRDGLGTLDVIQDKSVFLRRADFVALSVQNVRPVTVLQRAGDVVVVPGCLPHQVIIFHSINRSLIENKYMK